MNEKVKFAKCLSNTILDQIGNPFFGLDYLVNKINSGHLLKKREVNLMSKSCKSIANALENLRFSANNGFKNVELKSDRIGLICYLELSVKNHEKSSSVPFASTYEFTEKVYLEDSSTNFSIRR